MISVFKSENYRFRKSKEIWIMLLVLTGLDLAATVLQWCITHLKIFQDVVESVDTAPGMALDGFAGTAGGVLFRILALVMVGSLVTKLYQSGAAKQLVCSGISRRHIILGQFWSLTVTFFAAAVINAIIESIFSLFLGDRFGLTGGSYARFALAIAGMFLVVAFEMAFYMCIAHLTGSLGIAILLGLGLELGLPMVLPQLTLLIKTDIFEKYYFSNIVDQVTVLDGTFFDQVKNMGILAVYIVIFIALCQVVFCHKDVK